MSEGYAVRLFPRKWGRKKHLGVAVSRANVDSWVGTGSSHLAVKPSKAVEVDTLVDRILGLMGASEEEGYWVQAANAER